MDYMFVLILEGVGDCLCKVLVIVFGLVGMVGGVFVYFSRLGLR